MAPSNTLDKKTSEVQGSSRTVFQVVKIVGDLIDDELQVSDAHKCAGKKVDMSKRAVRVVTSAVGKVSKNQAVLGGAKDQLAEEQFSYGFFDYFFDYI